MSHLIEQEIELKQRNIVSANKAIDTLIQVRPFYDAWCEALTEPAGYLSSWSDSNHFYWSFTVKDIASEMAPRFEALANTIPLESWSSEDEPKSRKRVYKASINITEDVKAWVYINAHLADDATCRIEVLGYKDEEVSEYVTITKSVPITRLICPGEEA